MAKLSSLVKLQGTLFGLTFVDSKTYGKHVRAARGTHKPVKVNDTFKKMNGHLVAAQKPARLIKESIDPYRLDFKGGMLWHRLVSLFTLQHKNHGNFDLKQLEGFEVFDQYPLRRFLKLDTTVTVQNETASLKVVLKYQHHPTFPGAKFIDACSLQVIGIFPNIAKTSAESVAANAQTISLAGNLEALTFHLPIPPGATEYLICVKLDGISKGSVMAGHFTKGMSILKVGDVDHTSASNLTNYPNPVSLSDIQEQFLLRYRNTGNSSLARQPAGRHCTEHGVEPHALRPQLLKNTPVYFSALTMSGSMAQHHRFALSVASSIASEIPEKEYNFREFVLFTGVFLMPALHHKTKRK